MTAMSGHLLVIDDDADVVAAARLLLKRKVSRFSSLSHPSQLEAFLTADNVDVILLDMNFAAGENNGRAGIDCLHFLRRNYPHIIVVLMTAFAGVELAVSAIKSGATDFIIKPWSNEKLIKTLSVAFQLAGSQQHSGAFDKHKGPASNTSIENPYVFIGESPLMVDLMRKLDRCAPTEANVLILGENGSGKDLVAREIHRRSARADRIFLAIDMGAIPDNLFEAELFGYRKGAFTGANESRAGRLLAANGGTLFLDEIGNLPLHLQIKLLRVLEQRQVTPLGDVKSQPLDVRVIAATNAPLEQLQNEQVFRQDLLYRLNTVEIMLPPLRERKEDIPLLLDYFLNRHAQRYQRSTPSITETAVTRIINHAWPGNVRALSHAVERALVLSEKNVLDAGDFGLIESATDDTNSQRAVNKTENLRLDSLHLETLERAAVETALKKYSGNISHAANELGLTRTALYRRLEKYGL